LLWDASLKSGIAILIFCTEGELMSMKILASPRHGKRHTSKIGMRKLIAFKVVEGKVDIKLFMGLTISFRKRG